MANFDELIKSSENVLVDFYATWCGPCQTLMPILEELKEELGEKLRIIKIDVDRHQKFAAQMGVRGVPGLFFYKEGKLIKNTSGVLAKHEIKSIFDL
ncbi:MAG: thioredoxin [Flavobacteriales bacterium]|nr:thioredoxin [Flavobacteriales bacterium]|tara:strand:- start:2246 stop:2536 length:291 start_codon:yes stop_codon:yes gene_type:complete